MLSDHSRDHGLCVSLHAWMVWVLQSYLYCVRDTHYYYWQAKQQQNLKHIGLLTFRKKYCNTQKVKSSETVQNKAHIFQSRPPLSNKKETSTSKWWKKWSHLAFMWLALVQENTSMKLKLCPFLNFIFIIVI